MFHLIFVCSLTDEDSYHGVIHNFFLENDSISWNFSHRTEQWGGGEKIAESMTNHVELYILTEH